MMPSQVLNLLLQIHSVILFSILTCLMTKSLSAASRRPMSITIERLAAVSRRLTLRLRYLKIKAVEYSSLIIANPFLLGSGVIYKLALCCSCERISVAVLAGHAVLGECCCTFHISAKATALVFISEFLLFCKG